MKDYGSIVLVGGGLGIAPIYPIAKALKKIKNEVKVILGAKSKNHLFSVVSLYHPGDGKMHQSILRMLKFLLYF